MFVKPAKSERGRKRRQGAIANVRAELEPIELLAKRIRARAEAATGEHWIDGASWYRRAHEHCAQLATDRDLSTETVVGLVAVTSPQKSWGDNVRIVAEILEDDGWDHPELSGDVRRKVWAILYGADPDEVLGGRKVRSFYRNLLDPERSAHVTVDRHAVSIALGYHVAKNDRLLERIGAYQLVSATYRTVAREFQVPPHVIQAVTWLQYRDERLPELRYRRDDPDF